MKKENIIVCSNQLPMMARSNSALPTTEFERLMITQPQAEIAAVKSAEFEMSAAQAKMAMVSDSLDANNEEHHKLVAAHVRTLRSVAQKQEDAQQNGSELILSMEESNGSTVSQAALKAMPIRKLLHIINANDKASEAARSLTRSTAVSSTAMNIISYAQLGMGMHVDSSHPDYYKMVSEIETTITGKYGALSADEVMESMRDYNDRTSSKRTLGQYTPFSLSVLKAALEEYNTKRNRLLSAIKAEELRREQLADEQKRAKNEELYKATLDIYQQSLLTATAKVEFGSGFYVMDETILRMVNEGILVLSEEEKKLIKEQARHLMEEDIGAYFKFHHHKGKASDMQVKYSDSNRRNGESSLQKVEHLPSGVSVSNFNLWVSTPYFRARRAENVEKGFSPHEADRRAVYSIYSLKCAYYYTLRRAGAINDDTKKVAREALAAKFKKSDNQL